MFIKHRLNEMMLHTMYICIWEYYKYYIMLKPLSPKNSIYLIFYRKETEETEIR